MAFPSFPEFEMPGPPVAPGRLAPESAYQKAFDLLARRAPVEALELLEPALAEDPGNTGLRSLRAWAYLIRVQLGRAEDEFRSLIEGNPSDAWARHALGRALERQSRGTEALPHLRLAAAMTGDPVHVASVKRVEAGLPSSEG